MALTTQTTFLNLTLPVPTQQLGPQWAVELNAAFEVIDAHDHSSGKGVRIPTAGLNINADLNFNNNAALNLSLVTLAQQTSLPDGFPFNSSLTSFQGDLYYTNESGVAVQLTDGPSVVDAEFNLTQLTTTQLTASTDISPSDLTVIFLTDTSTTPLTITLPNANEVPPGRIYIIKDSTGNSNTNNITIVPVLGNTIDSSSDRVINSNFESINIVSDGNSNWSIY